jgi:hypothetical protein
LHCTLKQALFFFSKVLFQEAKLITYPDRKGYRPTEGLTASFRNSLHNRLHAQLSLNHRISVANRLPDVRVGSRDLGKSETVSQQFRLLGGTLVWK